MELSGMTVVIMLTKFPPILTFRTRCRALLRNGVEHYLVFGLASPPGRDHPSNSPTPDLHHQFVNRSSKRPTYYWECLPKNQTQFC